MKERDKSYQQGAVLITSLVILFAMTLIGVTALTTTRLEQSMAINNQALNQAFETAESGLAIAIENSEWIIDGKTLLTGSASNIDNYNGHFNYQRYFLGIERLSRQRSVIYSATRFRRAQFEIVSRGEVRTSSGESGATTTLTAGIYKIAMARENE